MHKFEANMKKNYTFNPMIWRKRTLETLGFREK